MKRPRCPLPVGSLNMVTPAWTVRAGSNGATTITSKNRLRASPSQVRATARPPLAPSQEGGAGDRAGLAVTQPESLMGLVRVVQGRGARPEEPESASEHETLTCCPGGQRPAAPPGVQAARDTPL